MTKFTTTAIPTALATDKIASETALGVKGYHTPLTVGNYAFTIQGADIASATTTDIGAATGPYIHITGTTTITGLGTVAAGTYREVKFTGALTLTHNGTSLILPDGVDIVTAANDTAAFRSLGSGNWICTWFRRHTNIASSSNIANASAVSLTTGGVSNITELTVGPGKWLLVAAPWFKGATSTTVSALTSAISTANNNVTGVDLAAKVTYGYNSLTLFNATPTAEIGLPPLTTTVTPTVSTTYYLNHRADFAVSTCAGFGLLRAIPLA